MAQHLARLLARRATLSPQREAVVDPGGRWTYAQFDGRCRKLAAHLIAQGVREGDRIAILAKNGEFAMNAVFAAARVGATAIMLNWRLQATELVYVLADSEPVGLLYDAAFAAAVQPLLAVRPLPVRIRNGGQGGDASYADILRDTPPDAADARGTGGSAIALIMYTSGTTGRPKGAMLSHEALTWAAQANGATLEWNQDHRFLLVAPLFHIGGMSSMFTNVLKGCTSVLSPDFDPVQVWKVIAGERITTLMCVPLMLQALLEVARKMPVDASSVVWATCGASAVPRPLIEAGLGMGIAVQQVYGITEFCGAVSFWTPEMGVDSAHTQGKVLMHGEVRVIDPLTLRELPAGEDGEICCRGPMAFSGYWRNQADTRAAFHNGWYRSGDVGHVDAQGFVHVVDRLKDMIISGGENIYPAELEAAIAELPGVAEVAVVGRADERWGEIPLAYVVCRPDARIIEADVIRACRERLAGYKCVKAVTFVDALPRNAVGKILKQQLRAPSGG
ncbi:AMP-dependent synthetase [Stenotrophomonas sp. Betaine-02u-21]|uniref:class I adenylate-forming enzyme family protein n=1 Tax=unclassified Stenotrophomonas TaxID=196198 RepID=UPI000C32EF8C|nr:MULTISPECIES: AMP-binding protein [unclassified Stenotrophomonas]PKH70233.1 AMP-dependent synthetase [Stenotrophomonas sp. Betaine-02u-23]PKH73784.1 AMP-dependent synthetase [Stenotrophomonas sp. Betaine-02u-21]PKH97657.1 AMP-dependent synthetase [Stenotrophomonas sp. Bg11-02]